MALDDPDDIACWQRIDDRLTTSGRLEPGDPARLKAIGVRRVINLALEDSPGALPEEAALMADADLAYLHIPVPFDAPDDTHFVAFASAMQEAVDQPVHVHCIMNWRVSAFVYRWHRMGGMRENDALAFLRRQWDPATSDHKDATAWTRFIGMP